jgi:hypothetical protein
MAAAFSTMGYFMPIFAFLLVFIVVYAFLKKTEVLSSNEPIMLFVSFIMASFFIVEANLVEFVRFTSSWFVVLVMVVFLAFVLLAFFPGKLDFLKKGWVSWLVFGLMIAFFIIASAYVFHWAVNWTKVLGWMQTDWFGMVLLLIIAIIVSFIIKGKAAS